VTVKRGVQTHRYNQKEKKWTDYASMYLQPEKENELTVMSYCLFTYTR